MFDTLNFQMYWHRPYVGGPKCGEYQSIAFTSVPAPGYVHAVWHDGDGTVVAEINQHESIRTQEDFRRALMMLVKS